MTNQLPALHPPEFDSLALPRCCYPSLAVVLAVTGLLIFPLGCGLARRPSLSGKLTVLVRPPERRIEPVSVEEPGAAPVKDGGAMCLDAKLNEPAFMYFVWLDSAGNVLPLYPWNNERLEVKDIGDPPPVRRATKLVFSPLLGGNWTFGESPGTEVVLLLARGTALPADVKLAELITPLPGDLQTKEVTTLGLDGGAKSVSVLSPAGKAAQPQSLSANDPLGQLLLRLGPHFELIRAVRFAHE